MPHRPSEDDLIARFFAPLAGPGGLGLKDDAALLRPPEGRDLVLTVDALVANVHFFADDPPEDIARKALRVNLSDLAAKGATPAGFLLSLALPPDWSAEWLERFARGLGEDAAHYRCPLLGGDTVKIPGPLTLSITALGFVARGRMSARTGARPGDLLYVSGTIGDAALGLQLRLGKGPELPPEHRDFLLDRYLRPQPRSALAGAVEAHASGGMDVSDGFVGDLAKMLRVSGVGAHIDLAMVPLSPAARAAVERDARFFDIAVSGGDDYELLISAPPAHAAALELAALHAGAPLTCVGRVSAAPETVFMRPDGTVFPLSHGKFSHF